MVAFEESCGVLRVLVDGSPSLRKLYTLNKCPFFAAVLLVSFLTVNRDFPHTLSLLHSLCSYMTQKSSAGAVRAPWPVPRTDTGESSNYASHALATRTSQTTKEIHFTHPEANQTFKTSSSSHSPVIKAFSDLQIAPSRSMGA